MRKPRIWHTSMHRASPDWLWGCANDFHLHAIRGFGLTPKDAYDDWYRQAFPSRNPYTGAQKVRK